jgi:hypothetical protein
VIVFKFYNQGNQPDNQGGYKEENGELFENEK